MYRQDKKEGKVQLIGRNNERKNVIIKYDNKCNQENILYPKLSELVCENIIEKDECYYGIAAEWAFAAHERRDKTVFKLDNIGNKVFEYNIFENDYSEFVSYLDSGDIATEGNIDPETGEINFGIIKGNIKDLLYRLSFTKSAGFKFGVSHSTNSEGAVDNLQFVGMFGEQEQEPIPVGNPDPND